MSAAARCCCRKSSQDTSGGGGAAVTIGGSMLVAGSVTGAGPLLAQPASSASVSHADPVRHQRVCRRPEVMAARSPGVSASGP